VSDNPRINALEAEIDALEKEVDGLVAIEEIRDVRRAYYSRLNEGQLGDLASLFTEDAKVDFGNDLGRAAGRREIADKISSVKSSVLLDFPHNHVVEVDGDRASGYLFVEGRLIVRGDSFVTAYKVSDTYVRRDGKWLIDSSESNTYYATPHQEGWAAAEPIQPFAAP